MTPYEHAILSVRDFGGIPEDYLEIHEFLDSTKAHCPNWKHRMFLHNGFGMLLAEKVCGPIVMNRDMRVISTREIARRHITEDLGRVPSLKEWVDNVTFTENWNQPRSKDLQYLRDHATNIVIGGRFETEESPEAPIHQAGWESERYSEDP